MSCPRCGSGMVTCIGSAEGPDTVTGEDEYVWDCCNCLAEWLVTKTGETRMLDDPETVL